MKKHSKSESPPISEAKLMANRRNAQQANSPAFRWSASTRFNLILRLGARLLWPGENPQVGQELSHAPCHALETATRLRKIYPTSTGVLAVKCEVKIRELHSSVAPPTRPLNAVVIPPQTHLKVRWLVYNRPLLALSEPGYRNKTGGRVVN